MRRQLPTLSWKSPTPFISLPEIQTNSHEALRQKARLYIKLAHVFWR